MDMRSYPWICMIEWKQNVNVYLGFCSFNFTQAHGHVVGLVQQTAGSCTNNDNDNNSYSLFFNPLLSYYIFPSFVYAVRH